MIKNKLKELLSELEKFKVQAILVLEYKKKKTCKIFNSCTKLIARDTDIDEAFKSMDQSFMSKIEHNACKNWIVLDIIMKHNINNSEC